MRAGSRIAARPAAGYNERHTHGFFPCANTLSRSRFSECSP